VRLEIRQVRRNCEGGDPVRRRKLGRKRLKAFGPSRREG
jgi:hypothetical protein